MFVIIIIMAVVVVHMPIYANNIINSIIRWLVANCEPYHARITGGTTHRLREKRNLTIFK
jgi:hypothetical protein